MVDGVDELVRLFHGGHLDTLGGLHPIPRTAVGLTESHDDLFQIVEGEPLFFQERNFLDRHRRGVVVFLLPIELEQGDFFRFPAANVLHRRLLAEEVAQHEFGIARKRPIVEIVDDEGEAQIPCLRTFDEFVCGHRRIRTADESRRADEGGGFGHAVDDSDLAPPALDKRLDGIILGRRAVDEIDGVVAALYDGFRQIFGEGSEVATIFVNVVQAFVGHAELRHRLVGSRIRRADENGHAVFCGMQNQFLATLRYVAFLYAKSDHRNHIHFSCTLISVSCTFILFRSSSDEVGSVSLCERRNATFGCFKWVRFHLAAMEPLRGWGANCVRF